MQLDKKERWLLANQYPILEAVRPDEAEHYASARKALESGYEMHYNWITEHIEDDVMTAAECKEVVDTLEMFSQMQRSYERLPDRSGIDADDLVFDGYDGNNEIKFMGYAEYFCEEQIPQRYSDLKLGRDRFNSHDQSRPRYQRMLEEWRRRRPSFPLSKEDITAILAAASVRR